jgi:hypothetical protein
MPRAYIRVIPDLYDRKALGIRDGLPPRESYPPPAFGAFIGTLCLAEHVSPRGRFRSRQVLESMLSGPNGEGKAYARQVGYLIKHGDLVEMQDGSLYLDGWDELQEGRDATVTDRVKRWRERQRNDGVTRNAEPSNGPSRAPEHPRGGEPLAVSGEQRAQDGGEPPSVRANGIDQGRDGLPHVSEYVQMKLEEMTGRPATVAGDRQLTELDRLIEDHGEERVIDALSAVRQSMTDRPTARQLVWAAMKRLEPIPSSSDLGRVESEAEAERSRAHRDELRERHLAELRAQPTAPAAPFSALVPRPGTPEATR